MDKNFILKIKKCGVRAMAERFTSLRQTNSNTWMGHCPNPNHDDKHESFMIRLNDDGIESWCCFACHKGPKDKEFKNYGSDNIAFMQWLYANKTGKELAFREAVRAVAKFYGIPMEARPYEAVYQNNARLCAQYEASITAPVKAYLYDRGLDDNDIKKWHLGFDGNRITFPIFTADEDIVGFSNRAFSKASVESGPKYINSQASPIFKKKELFYGINHARKSGSDSLFIVEGQMDAILAHKYGIDNAVATMTCKLSPWHINWLKEHNKHPVLCYDFDKAGAGGMEKAMNDLYVAGVKNIKMVRLPDKRDIADLGKDLKGELKDFVQRHTISYSQYLLGGIADELDASILSTQQRLMPNIRKALDTIGDPDERTVAENFIRNRIMRTWSAA